MQQRRTFLRGISGLFVAATLPVPTNLLASDHACTCEIELLQEQYIENPNDFGHIVQWLARSGNQFAAVAVAVANWNDLEMRESARIEAKRCLRRHFNRKGT